MGSAGGRGWESGSGSDSVVSWWSASLYDFDAGDMSCVDLQHENPDGDYALTPGQDYIGQGDEL